MSQYPPTGYQPNQNPLPPSPPLQQYGNQAEGSYQPQYYNNNNNQSGFVGGEGKYQHNQQQQQYNANQTASAAVAMPQHYQANGGKMEHQGGIVTTGQIVYLYDDNQIQAHPELKKFVVGEYHDVWATILFLISFIATIVVGSINIAQGKLSDSSSPGVSSGGSNSTTDHLIKGAGVGFGFATVLTFIMLLLMKAFARQFIYIANVFIVLVFIAFAVVGFISGSTTMGVLGILFALILLGFLLYVRHMVPFSSLLLEWSINGVMEYYGTILFSFLALAFVVVYYIFWVAMVVPTLNSLTNNGAEASSGATWLFLLFLVMFFWAEATSRGVVHVTTGGVLATWFMVGDRDGKEMPPNLSGPSFKRAVTTSFGSICFGSLILAILKTIEYIAESAARSNNNGACACIAHCVISCLRRIMEYFNNYALSHIAITGDSYIDAAKATWDFMMHSLFTALINDILVERVMFLVSAVIVVITCVATYFIFDQSWSALLGGLLSALIVNNIVLNTVASGVVTLMVCVAEYGDVFRAKHPQKSQELNEAIRHMRENACCGGGGGGDDGY